MKGEIHTDNHYVFAAISNFSPDPDNDVMESFFKQYERVIVESLITSFGLDFIVKDRHGGDVDTINNVRKMGSDPQMTYKNKANEEAYNNMGKYNDQDYKKDSYFQEMKSKARNDYRDNGRTVEDAYTGNVLHFLGKSKGANPKINAEVDHVIATKTIHDDRGRVLSGLDGKTLANSPENLQFTNKSLNASMQDAEIPDYIEKHPELPTEVKEKMMKHYNKSKSAYEAKLACAYYTSPAFAKDVAKAAGDVGAKMGLRQALGFIFTEVWFAVKDEFMNIHGSFDLSGLFIAIGNGIKRGFKNAKQKYKEIFVKFCEGAIAGTLSSLTTTLCNIFFTTAKNVVKIIRQTYASVVQAVKILLINPDNLPFGEQMRAVVKVLAIGTSIVVGGFASETIGKTAIGAIPTVGDIVQTFCGSLITGIMSCSLLYFLDRSEIMNKLVSALNSFRTASDDVNYFYRQAAYFESYAAEIMKIDIEKFREETAMYCSLADEIENVKSETELNSLLKNVIDKIGVKIPWEGEFDSFMRDRNVVLVFE